MNNDSPPCEKCITFVICKIKFDSLRKEFTVCGSSFIILLSCPIVSLYLNPYDVWNDKQQGCYKKFENVFFKREDSNDK